MWGTEATSTVTQEDGPVTVFVAVGHCTVEAVGLHATRRAIRVETLKPIRQGAVVSSARSRRAARQGCKDNIITAVNIERRFPDRALCPRDHVQSGFVRAPEGNGIAQCFISSTPSRNHASGYGRSGPSRRCVWHTRSSSHVQRAVLVERQGFRPPAQVRRAMQAPCVRKDVVRVFHNLGARDESVQWKYVRNIPKRLKRLLSLLHKPIDT